MKGWTFPTDAPLRTREVFGRRGRKGYNRFVVSPFKGSGVRKLLRSPRDAWKRPLRAGFPPGS